MGYADVQTTMKYKHHRSRAGDARLLSAAFRLKPNRDCARGGRCRACSAEEELADGSSDAGRRLLGHAARS